MSLYILMQTTTAMDPSKRVHHPILIFAISSWVIENNSSFLMNFYNNYLLGKIYL